MKEAHTPKSKYPNIIGASIEQLHMRPAVRMQRIINQFPPQGITALSQKGIISAWPLCHLPPLLPAVARKVRVIDRVSGQGIFRGTTHEPPTAKLFPILKPTNFIIRNLAGAVPSFNFATAPPGSLR